MKATILISASLLLAVPSFAATALHHYTFNGSGVDDSIGTANGTLLNGAAIASGRLNLDGSNDYVQFGQHIIPVASSFSVAFFAQEPAAQANHVELISQGSSGAPGFYIGYDPSHNFRLGDNVLSTGIAFPNDGLLHHYALTAGSDTRLYIDGSLAGTFVSIGMTSGGSDTRLGRQFAPYDELFNGQLDELWIFDGTLTAGEVASLAIVPEPASLAMLSLAALVFAGRFLRHPAAKTA